MTADLTPTHLAALRICALPKGINARRDAVLRHEQEGISVDSLIRATYDLVEAGLADTDFLVTDAGRVVLASAQPDTPVELCSGPPGYLPARARERALARGEEET